MRQNMIFPQNQGSEYRYLNPALSMSGKSFHNIEQSSKSSSIFSGATGGEIPRHLPPPPNKNFDIKSGQYLPIGINQYPNQSYAGYQKLLQMIHQNESEQQYRMQSMHMDNTERVSGMSKDNESMPSFTFQNDEKLISNSPRKYPVFGSTIGPERSNLSQFSMSNKPLKIGKSRRNYVK
jgi:hypothetical protein